MNRHTVVTILFGLCFLFIAAITIPFSHVVYISASVTTVIHYLIAQLLVKSVAEPRHQYLYYYLCCVTVGLIGGLACGMGGYTDEVMSDMTKASLGVLLPSGIGFCLVIFGFIHAAETPMVH